MLQTRFFLLAFISVLAASAHAALITATAAGRIVLLSHPFTTRFAEGQTFTYTFSYESTATPITNQGTIRSIPLQSASLRINATPVWESGSISGPQLSVINGSGTQTDRIAAVATISTPAIDGTGVFAGTFMPASIGMELYAPSSRITNTNVPTSFTLSDWNPYALVAGSNIYVMFRDRFGALYTVRGEIQSLTSTGGSAPGAPEISTQPRSQLVAAGAAVALSVTATGAGNTYQWHKDGRALAGATAATLTLANVSTADAGTYSVVVTNAAGSITSANAALGVTATSNAGRLVNMSIRTNAGTGDDTLIVGLGIGGANTSGSKAVLIRGVGPTLATSFGLSTALADPVMTAFQGQTQIAQNDDWTGSFNFASLGAFAFAGSAPRDAAIHNDAIPSGSYSIQIAGKNNATGLALAEIYDATPANAFAATTPRLVNVSARTQVGTGDNILIAGFAIGGTTPVRVLIRAAGPALTHLGVGGALTDPRLEVFNATNASIASNDNWSGTAALKAAFTRVAAFSFPADNSRDAAVIAELQPGSYTAQISGVNNTTGVALVELYELP